MGKYIFTRAAGALPVANATMDAAPITDSFTNIFAGLESASLKSGNVDTTNVDGIVSMDTTQTITGDKTFAGALTISGTFDLNGAALKLDADADTSWSAAVDDVAVLAVGGSTVLSINGTTTAITGAVTISTTLAVTGASQFTGDVGIGTAASYNLHVKDAIGNAVVGIEATGGDTYQLISHGTGTGLTVGDFSLYDTSTAAHRFVVDANGLLGVRVQNPAAQLHVGLSVVSSAPALSANTVAVFENAGSIGANATIAIIADVDGTSAIRFGDDDIEGRASIAYNHDTEVMTLVSNTNTVATIDGSGNLDWMLDQNKFFYLGKARIGLHTGFTNYAAFSHAGFTADTTNYALVQDINGATFLNAAVGEVLSLGNAGTVVSTISNTAFASDINFSVTRDTDAKISIITDGGGGAGAAALDLDAARTATGNVIGDVMYRWNGNAVAYLRAYTGDDAVGEDGGELAVFTADAGAGSEVVRFTQEATVLLNIAKLPTAGTGPSGTIWRDAADSNTLKVVP